MFGNNPIRRLDRVTESLAVQEIFYTIQGEGPHTGHPAVFIRLAGCNLACIFCDTEFESGMDNRMSPAQIVAVAIRKAGQCNTPSEGMRLVVLTGGEPLRQSCGRLIAALLEAGAQKVQIETAGTVWDPELVPFIEAKQLDLVCSPKTPKINPAITRYCRHYKYIIRHGDVSPEDGLPTRGTQDNNQHLTQQIHRPWLDRSPLLPDITVWVAPCDEHDDEINMLNTEAAVSSSMRYGYRLSVQVHKIVKLP